MFAQSPQALVFDNFVRIYFSTRQEKSATGMFASFISYVDFTKDFSKILKISDRPVIQLGEPGTFDEHGIFPFSPLNVGDKIIAYTCGWSRRKSVPVETSIGLAVSLNQGESFEKVGAGPILTASIKEPFLVGDAFVRIYNDTYHMWYIFGTKWIPETSQEPPSRVYKIGHALSCDGVTWNKEEAQQVIKDRLSIDECQALPSVLKIGNRYHMYFCYREASDFRNNSKRSYKIGYAYSENLRNWTRDDNNSGITLTANSWDSDMMCYPNIFQCEHRIYLLYNGNEFGKHGFGLAELEHE